MISAKIDENGIILNVIVATPQEAELAFGGVWVECPEWVGIGMNINTPQPTPGIPTAEENKQTAILLLQETDWTSVGDVGNPEMSNPYLANQAEFINYRNTIRQYIIYPVAGIIEWPEVPQVNWIKV